MDNAKELICVKCKNKLDERHQQLEEIAAERRIVQEAMSAKRNRKASTSESSTGSTDVEQVQRRVSKKKEGG